MKILIVDDDKMMLEAISHCLKAEGFETATALDGFLALDVVQREKIDLIISDLMMPNISGLGLLNLLKRFYYNNVPIIIVSSLDKSDMILRSFGLGASEYLTKPVNFSKLVGLVRKYTKKHNGK